MPSSRTFTWTPPDEVAARARQTDGLSFLRSICGADRAQAAPVAQCLDFQLVEVEHGRVVFALVPAGFHFNPIGTVHGGVLATLCDSAAGAAVHSTLAAGEAYTSLEIKVSFLRAVTVATGPLRCEGTVLTRGGRVATAQAHLRDAAGGLHAHATSTCLLLGGERRTEPR